MRTVRIAAIKGALTRHCEEAILHEADYRRQRKLLFSWGGVAYVIAQSFQQQCNVVYIEFS